MAEVAIERYGTIDVLCANAGIFPASKLDMMTAQEFDAVIGTNLRDCESVSIRRRPWIRPAYGTMSCGSTFLRGRARPE